MPRKAHYSNLSIKHVNRNKKFWKIVQPLFSEKADTNENTKLADKNNITSEIDITENLNAFFSNTAKELNIKVKEDLLCHVSNINDSIERVIQKYKNHPSVQMIMETFGSNKNIFI